MNSSPTIGKLAAALATAQGEIINASKDAKNPFFNSKYADLATVIEACKGPLSRNGVAFTQSLRNRITPDGAFAIVETILFHAESGEWISAEIEMPVLPSVVQKGAPPAITAQGFGSAFTYGRRYGLSAAVGIAQVDDDATDASGKRDEKPEPVKMTPEAFANHQAALEGCDTVDALKDAWIAASKACGDDRESLTALMAVKDAMKAKVAK